MLLVPGTVLPLDAPAGAAAGREDLVPRSLALAAAVDRLWGTFRLDPARRLQKGAYLAAPVGAAVELPVPDGAAVKISARLLGFDDQLATFRVIFREGETVLADSTVGVDARRPRGGGRARRRGRALSLRGSRAGSRRPAAGAAGRARARVARAGGGRTRCRPTIRRRRARRASWASWCSRPRSPPTAGSPTPGAREPVAAAHRRGRRRGPAWAFEPARDAAGRAVAVRYVVTLNFTLR